MANFNGVSYTFASFAPYAYASIWDQFWDDVLAEMTSRAAAMGGALPAFATTWDAGTADADPGIGEIRGNAPTLAATTQLYISSKDALGSDVSAVIGLFDDSTSTPKGLLRIAHRSNQTLWALFAVTGAVTMASGYGKVPVSYIAGPGGFAGGNPLALGFVPKGDIGQTGANGGISGGNATGAINETAVTVSSAATTDIGAAAGNAVRITGTTTITAFGTAQSGARRHVTFSGALTLTHNAASLILPGGANIYTAAGDTAEFESLGAGNWRCMEYNRASGISLPAVGSVLAVPVTPKVAPVTWGATITLDLTAGNKFPVTLGGATTFANPTLTAAMVGMEFTIITTQDATGNRTQSFGGYFKFPNGTAPTGSTAAGKRDRVICEVVSTTAIDAVFVKGF